jgi:hypothetical protein
LGKAEEPKQKVEIGQAEMEKRRLKTGAPERRHIAGF